MLNPATLKNDSEQYERYYDKILRCYMYQYDYRDSEGTLYSCIAKSLELCRQKRDRARERKLIK